MHPVIHFRSRQFDVSLEPGNPINPIRGSSLLDWLRSRLPANVEMSAPMAEDWGWYCDVDWHGRHYMVGACANEEPDGNHEWVLQIDKLRSFREKLFGREKMTVDDPCLACLKNLIALESNFTDVFAEDGP